MELKYKGPLKLDQVIAKIVVSKTRADVGSEYYFRNPSRNICMQRFNFAQNGISKLILRTPTALRPSPTWANNNEIKKFDIKKLDATIQPLSNLIIDTDFSVPIIVGMSKHFQFIPNLDVESKKICEKVIQYNVTIELPPEAKHIIKTSVPPTRVTKDTGKMVCVFEQDDAYLMPISIKWTELDVNLTLSKSARQLTENKIQVTVNIKNNGGQAVNNINLKDEYSELQAAAPEDEKGVNLITPHDRSSRIVWSTECNLEANEKKTFKYNIIKQGSGVKVPSTIATVNNEIVGIAESHIFFPLPAPAFSRSTAFALPSGWSFDYLYGGDHHINEHGMWCSGQHYDS